MSRGLVLANFGGPRSLEEVEPFLVELLTDGDVIKTVWPRFFEKWFFTKVAKKRAKQVAHDYAKIGGKSPIYEDTEKWADVLREKLHVPVFVFHRYLVSLHGEFLKKVEESGCERLAVLPLYPQFSFATTGSIRRFFECRMSEGVLRKMQWIESFATHPAYIAAMQRCIGGFLQEKNLREVVLFFSAHGLPQKFTNRGDPYQEQCRSSFELIRKSFPECEAVLAFQSKFGRGEWLRPYTVDLCRHPPWNKKKDVVFVPLSFTSDHIETLFEIEELYLPLLRSQGVNAYRCPALNQQKEWLEAMEMIVSHTFSTSSSVL
jgi:protoporphyrin/coproporphyrin ferrochelatase